MHRPDFNDVPDERRAVMRAVRGKHTRPELTVRRTLHRAGYRYRLHVRELPGRPDLVFAARRKVIEIRGCFWHRHPDPSCRNAVLPRTRSEWWEAKLSANVTRDLRNETALSGMGWATLVIWECEVGRDDLLDRVRAYLGAPGSGAGRRAPGAGRGGVWASRSADHPFPDAGSPGRVVR